MKVKLNSVSDIAIKTKSCNTDRCTCTCTCTYVFAWQFNNINDALLLLLILLLLLLLLQIDPVYLLRSDSRLSINHETRLNCSRNDIEMWQKQKEGCCHPIFAD